MSAQAVIAVDAPTRDRRSWISIAVASLILVAVIALAVLHLLVDMTNSREDKALLPAVVQPGETVSGDLYLADVGLLPLTYSLQPREPAGTNFPPHLTLTVQRLDDGAYLYRGPVAATPDLDTVNPGQSSHLKVSITSDDATQAAAIPIPLIYYWPARPVLPWWWSFAALALLVALLGFGFYRRGRGR
jgi:hypothetical protein